VTRVAIFEAEGQGHWADLCRDGESATSCDWGGLKTSNFAVKDDQGSYRTDASKVKGHGFFLLKVACDARG